jgi:hypothetical protein
MTSAAYRQSSTVTAEQARLDPDNRLCSRMPLVRLDAEETYDALLVVAGRLNGKPFGPADPVKTRPDGLVTPAESGHDWRRLIYVQQARKQLPTHLETFDSPPLNPNCLERRESTVAPQALYLMNNGMILRLAEDFAGRVRREAGTDPAAQVECVYRIALSRPPSALEKKAGVEALTKLTETWARHQDVGPVDRDTAGRQALTTYCHAIVNSASFLYVD